MTTRTLTEQIADWHTGRTVDRAARTVRNVALAGLTSKNGYRYTEPALRDAARLYEHKPVFLDHAGDKSRPHERSTRDLVGTIVSPRFESGRIRADVRVLDTESGRTFLALAELDAPGVGMSHVVLAERASVDGAVERIREVVSVDAVVFPATTTTFRESIDADSNRERDDEAPAEPTTQEAANIDLHDRVQQLLAERDALRGQLQAIRERDAAEARERCLQQQLDASGLPRAAVTELFREQLRQADDASRTRLIADRRELIAAMQRTSPVSVERTHSRSTPDATTAFVKAVKRHAF